MKFLTDFADQAVILPLALAVGLVLLLVGWVRGAISWWVGVGSTLAVMLVLKLVLIACGSQVPELHLHSPSGHTASAAVVYGGILGLVIPQRGHLAGKLVGVAVLALLFGTTRVALHAHSVPEVLLGGAIGLAGALLLVGLAGERPPSAPSRRVGLLIGGVAIAICAVLHGYHLGAEREIDRWTFRFWPLTACRAQ